MSTTASGDWTDAEPAVSLSGQVRSTVGLLYRRFRSERPEGALGDSTLDVLVWLFKKGPQTLTELSEYAQVAPASMSQSVNRLTSAGYAVRTPDPADRRKVVFRTTPEGSALAGETRAKRDAWLDAKLQELNADEQRAIAYACELLSGLADP